MTSPFHFPNPFPPQIRTAAVIAPAGKLDPAKLEAGLRQLHAWGIHTLPGAHLAGQCRTLAGDDDARLADLETALADPRADVILPARGGFGCARLLDRLDPKLLRDRATPIVGYSDVSILHLARFKAGVVSGLSGPMPAVEFARCAAPAGAAEAEGLALALESLRRSWTPQHQVWLPPQTRLQVLKPGAVTAPVMPVNLTVLVSLLGTPHMPDLDGVLLAIEDVNEAAHRVDRNLTQLRQAGILARLGGLLIGRFTRGEDAEWLPAIFAESAAQVRGPVVEGLPYGHELPPLTVPAGRTAVLEASADGRVHLGW